MRHLAILMLATLAVSGCSGHTIHMTTVGRLVSETPPVSNASPVYAQVVPGGNGPGARVAVVDVDGLLMNTDMTGASSFGENPVSLFRERLDAAAADPLVRAVVVRINSHGGAVTACDIMHHDLLSFKQRTGLPVVACLLDVGTGGGYYLAAAADQIVAQPATITGGIGVLMNVYDLLFPTIYANTPSGGKEKPEVPNGVVPQPIRPGPYIDLGSPIHTFNSKVEPGYGERLKLLFDIATRFHGQFIEQICRLRPIDPLNSTNFDGRVFTAVEAQQRRFIDHVGYLDDAIALARQVAGVAQAEVVLYHRSNDRARSPYSTTPNEPITGGNLFGMSTPGLDRSRLPGFLFMWQPEPTMEKLTGR